VRPEKGWSVPGTAAEGVFRALDPEFSSKRACLRKWLVSGRKASLWLSRMPFSGLKVREPAGRMAFLVLKIEDLFSQMAFSGLPRAELYSRIPFSDPPTPEPAGRMPFSGPTTPGLSGRITLSDPPAPESDRGTRVAEGATALACREVEVNGGKEVSRGTVSLPTFPKPGPEIARPISLIPIPKKSCARFYKGEPARVSRGPVITAEARRRGEF